MVKQDGLVSRSRWFWVYLLWLLSWTAHPSAFAHDLYKSYTWIEVGDTAVTTTFTFDVKDVAKVLGVQAPDEVRSTHILSSREQEIVDFFAGHVSLTLGGRPLQLQRGRAEFVQDEAGNRFVQVAFTSPISAPAWKLRVGLHLFTALGNRHTNLAKIVHGDEVQQALFTVDKPDQDFVLSASNVPVAPLALQFVWLGMNHIFIGYDHILFLLGLIVIGGSFRNLVKIVTAFTLAHSLTLVLAALQIVLLPTRLVESVIALSIVYIAVENFFVKDSDQRWLITFVFGLMHGFGFASVLTELGLPRSGLAVSLVSFNVGVEIGQIAIIGLVFPVVQAFSRTRWQKQLVLGLSSVILVFGLIWFFQRAFDVGFV